MWKRYRGHDTLLPDLKDIEISYTIQPNLYTKIIFPWPFMRWGMDIVGKILIAPGGKFLMLIMTDYFSKWIATEAFVQNREN